ncbi:MAG: 1-acyl-sn-glycerol-3-phosphate acyltransferase [Thermoleophilaceae bacterium]
MPESGQDSFSRRLARYHERTRRRGVNRFVYWTARAVLEPAIVLYFRLRRTGRRHIPDGAVILATNHRSFLDPFLVGICASHPVYFMAKKELFRNRLLGWLLSRLGAFPVRRGESDAEAVRTSLELLERGQPVVIFPEGTRIRTGSLAAPRRGVGRLALASGAPVVPIAIKGSERARRGWRIRPVKVHVRCGPPLRFPRVANPSPELAREVTARIWPCVELQWEWLGGLPPLRTAAVIGGGSMGTATATLLARAGLDVKLACRTFGQAKRLASERENARYLPGVALEPGIQVCTIADVEPAAVDLLVLALPCDSLPEVVARLGTQVGPRTAVLVVSKGLVPPLGSPPATYVAERVRARATAWLGGPAHAREALESGAAVVLATRDADLRRQLGNALEQGGLRVESTDDVTGAELAACAKNAAALAAAAAFPRGANLAGAAAGRVFAEVYGLALEAGGRPETFAGLAGTGDLVATALAEGSRNRRAGELVGQGLPAQQVRTVVDQTAESLATVPLLDEAMDRAGVEGPITTGLREVIEARRSAESWLELVLPARQERTRHAA